MMNDPSAVPKERLDQEIAKRKLQAEIAELHAEIAALRQ
jgi:hypothetical protein